MKIIGIDPGVTGAIAMFEHGKLSSVADLPVADGEIDAVELNEMFLGCSRFSKISCVVLEETHAMPKTGSQANYSQGLSKGLIVATVKLAKIPLQRVAPATWKTKMGLRGKDKAFTLRLVNEMYPDHAESFRRAKDHNRADAVMIARYGVFHLMHHGYRRTNEAS